MLKLSWGDIETTTDQLADTIRASGFKPDYAVGITMGGLIPLYYLAKKLKLEHIITISVRSYVKDEQKDLEVTYLPEVDLTDKKILLIDEITDSGRTLKKISDLIIEQYHAGEVKIATLAVNTENCKFYPDFYIIESAVWVAFPWEKSEFPEFF